LFYEAPWANQGGWHWKQLLRMNVLRRPMSGPTGRRAIVRGVPSTYDRCIRTNKDVPIDIDLARRQHAAYCNALRDAGLRLVSIEPDDQYPDCCFVEDTAIVVGERAIISRMASESRKGEIEGVREILRLFKLVHDVRPPGTIDGGDVQIIDNKMFIGVSERTSTEAIMHVEELVSDAGFEVVPVELSGILHLKSAMTYLGNGCVVMYSGHFDKKLFAEYKQIHVPRGDEYAANCLAVNGIVLMSKGFPGTRNLIKGEGFDLRELETTEFRKGDGSLTCLSIIL